MKWLFAMLLAFALAGCAESRNFEREKPIKLAAPIEPILSPTKPVLRKSALEKAEASKTNANESTKNSSLMECISEACKIQCSRGLEKESRPKWCMYFKEPIDRHASEIHGKSAE